MNSIILRLKSSLTEYKHLYAVSFFTFLLIYLPTFNKSYGYFIDEFYYIACAFNPAFGYVDHPPLAPLVLTVFQFVFGTSLYAIRILPALAAAAAIFYTGVLTKEIGGKSLTDQLFGVFKPHSSKKTSPAKKDISNATESGFIEGWKECTATIRILTNSISTARNLNRDTDEHRFSGFSLFFFFETKVGR